MTRLPPPAGSAIVEGAVVIGVSGRPVFLMEGEVPVYRTLAPGMAGEDIAQLQAALARLGYSPETDGFFGGGTKLAVRELYRRAGFQVIESSVRAADVAAAEQAARDAELSLLSAQEALADARSGRSGSGVVAARAAVDAAGRALNSAKATRDENNALAVLAVTSAQNASDSVFADPVSTLAERDQASEALASAQTAQTRTAREGEDAVASATEMLQVAQSQLAEAQASNDVEAAERAVGAAATARDAALANLWTVTVNSGPTVPQGEIVFLPTVPARVQTAASSLGEVDEDNREGGGGGADSGLVQLSAGKLIVSTSIRAGDESLVRVGMPVELLGEVTNLTYPATVAEIADAATVYASGQLGRVARVLPDEELPDELTGVNVRVTITAASSDGPVLVVPLAAVSSSAGGATRVSVLQAGSDSPVDVLVTAGVSADGFIAVVPVEVDTLAAGDLVVVGR